MNETGLNARWIGEDMSSKKTQDFTKAVLNHMREKLMDYQEQYGDLYNLEATPAESTSYRLAKHDKKQYPDIITAGDCSSTPYYTNSSHLPVGYTADIFEALDIQDELQTLYTSGTVFHAFLGEKLPDWKAAAKLVKTISDNYRLPYYTLSPVYSVCRDHGYLSGEQKVCPHCGKKTEIYSRITGYYRPVSNWNDGKLQEYKDRVLYDTANSKLDKAKRKKVLAGNENPEPKREAPDASIVTILSSSDIMGQKGVSIAPAHTRRYLFTTKTCPNCRIVKDFLKNIKYIEVDAEENTELAMKFSVSTAPTLVIVEGDKFEKISNASNIKKFVDGMLMKA